MICLYDMLVLYTASTLQFTIGARWEPFCPAHCELRLLQLHLYFWANKMMMMMSLAKTSLNDSCWTFSAISLRTSKGLSVFGLPCILYWITASTLYDSLTSSLPRSKGPADKKRGIYTGEASSLCTCWSNADLWQASRLLNYAYTPQHVSVFCRRRRHAVAKSVGLQ